MPLVYPEFRDRLKFFIPVWTVPFVAIAASINQEMHSGESIWFNELFAVFYFMVCNTPFLVAWTRGLIPLTEMILFWMVTPFLLWACLVMIKVNV